MEQQSFLDKMVRTVIWLNSIFAAIILLIFAIRLQEPSTLIKYWFGSFTAELLAMAAITITKNWKSKKVEEEGGEPRI